MCPCRDRFFAIDLCASAALRFRLMPPPVEIYYDDLAIGRVYRSDSIEVTADEITTFAARYDPQPFHLDAVAAKRSAFGGLVASGWLTASLTMRLMMTGEFHFA